MISDALHKELRRFVRDHPHGWGHDDWLRLLFHLSENGVDTANEDAIGLALEGERLKNTLANLGVKGLGPKRIEAVADRYGTVWNLKDASWEAVAELPGIPETLARELVRRIRQS
jgi:hypothetical protein